MTSTKLRLRTISNEINHSKGKFERKILRRTFGPVRENDLGWEPTRNEELHELSDGPDIVKVKKDYSGQVTQSEWIVLE